MEHFHYIYNFCTADYHRMIAAEDVDGNLLSTLKNVAPFHGKRVLDLGTGTGRIPLLLGKQAAHVVGLDLSYAMLRQNQAEREQAGGSWSLIRGDMRRLPVATGWAEICCAGWSIGHFRGWFSKDWHNQVSSVLNEMQRVTRIGGCLLIIETLGTGCLKPSPPPLLSEYYLWLEQERGFSRLAISTDYQFSTVEEAVRYTEFFFGPELAKNILQEGWSRLPEWTGVWWKQV
jgi:ubiquinone/menaquinone biosynthesis C-methylase UbiE